jgi:DNA-binding Xre family transcriptional regulator
VPLRNLARNAYHRAFYGVFEFRKHLAVRETDDWAVDIAVLNRARVLHGWTRRDLGREAHVDEGTLCDLFAGRRRPTFGTLHAVCGALNLSLEDVVAFGDRG